MNHTLGYNYKVCTVSAVNIGTDEMRNMETLYYDRDIRRHMGKLI
jgi:hypothetical protein